MIRMMVKYDNAGDAGHKIMGTGEEAVTKRTCSRNLCVQARKHSDAWI